MSHASLIRTVAATSNNKLRIAICGPAAVAKGANFDAGEVIAVLAFRYGHDQLCLGCTNWRAYRVPFAIQVLKPFISWAKTGCVNYGIDYDRGVWSHGGIGARSQKQTNQDVTHRRIVQPIGNACAAIGKQVQS